MAASEAMNQRDPVVGGRGHHRVGEPVSNGGRCGVVTSCYRKARVVSKWCAAPWYTDDVDATSHWVMRVAVVGVATDVAKGWVAPLL